MKNILTLAAAAAMLLAGAPAAAAGMSQTELEIWNSASFQKSFAESYIAETEIEPRVTSEQRKILQKIMTLMSAEQMDEAAVELENNRGPATTAVFDFMLANIYFQQEKLDKAAATYLDAVTKYPKFRRAWKNLGIIYVRQGDFEKARPALTKVLELGGTDSVTYGLLGYCFSSLENPLAAESAYRMAIMLDPKTKDWQMGFVRSLFRQQRFADAAAMCGTLLDKEPERADLWLLQANAYIGLGKPKKAAENYELLIRLGKATPASLNMLGDIYVNDGLFEMAVTAYVKAIEADLKAGPERAVRAAKVLVSRGALEQTKRLVERINALQGKLLTDEQRKDLLKLQARMAVAEGSDDAEAKILEQIVALDPLDGEALILLGTHSRRSGDIEKAANYFERAAAIEKFEADAKVRHAQMLVAEGKYTQAIPLLKAAQQVKPRDNIQKYLDQVERVAKQR